MGMFDYVNFEIPCPICGTKVKGFQTKAGECLMEIITPQKAGNFYDSCSKCDAWIYVTAIPPQGEWKYSVSAGPYGQIPEVEILVKESELLVVAAKEEKIL